MFSVAIGSSLDGNSRLLDGQRSIPNGEKQCPQWCWMLSLMAFSAVLDRSWRSLAGIQNLP